MRSVIRHLLVLTGLGLALAACGHRDQRLVDQYFNAVNSKDNQTLGSFAAVGSTRRWTAGGSRRRATRRRLPSR